MYSSPSRQAKKRVDYAESDAEEEDDEDDHVFKPLSGNRRAAKRRRMNVKEADSEDEYAVDADVQAAADSDDGMHTFS